MQYHDTTRRQFTIAVGAVSLSLAGAGVGAARRSNRNFRTHLSGENEVPPVETDAQGQAIFQLSKDGSELTYKLIVANIEDVVASHIHCAPEGENGPVGVTLFTGGPTSDDGILAEGTITDPDDGNACGWEDLDEVIAAMRAGNTYVNVHTLAHPPGEIRGQIH